MNRRCFLSLIALGLATLPAAAAGPLVVYVSNGASKSISVFHLEAASGALTAKGEVALADNPGPLALSPDGRTLYAALRATKSLQALSIAPADGALTAGAAVPIGINPAYLFIDRTGRNLLTSDYGGDRVNAHRIDADGSVNPQPVSDLPTGRNPHSVQADPANRFAFVPLCGADQVLQFRFDPATGALTANEPPAVAFRPVDGPRHFAFHPTAPLVAVVNEKSSSVTSMKYDAAAGTLTAIETLPTIPQGGEVKNSCADIHFTPDGKYLYASNRGHDSLAGYAVDAASGKLRALGQTPTEKTPRSFAIEASGQYLLAAGQGSGKLAVYRIDAATGALQPLQTYEVGKGPAWVLVK